MSNGAWKVEPDPFRVPDGTDVGAAVLELDFAVVFDDEDFELEPHPAKSSPVTAAPTASRRIRGVR
jgi:hypothetical protein